MGGEKQTPATVPSRTAGARKERKPRISSKKPEPEPIITKRYDELKLPRKSVARLCGKVGLIVMISISEGINYSYAIAKAFSTSPNTVNRAKHSLENVALLKTKSVVTRGHRLRNVCELTDMGLLVLNGVAKEAMKDDKHIMHDCLGIIDKFKKSDEWKKMYSIRFQKVLE